MMKGETTVKKFLIVIFILLVVFALIRITSSICENLKRGHNPPVFQMSDKIQMK